MGGNAVYKTDAFCKRGTRPCGKGFGPPGGNVIFLESKHHAGIWS